MANATIEYLNDGFILPLTFIQSAGPGQEGRFDGSVHYQNGELCSLGTVGLPGHVYEPQRVEGESIENINGCATFGGLLHNEHFGHFVTESLVRLWAFDHLKPSYDCVVFYVRERHVPVAKFVGEFLSILVPGINVKIIDRPVQIEMLAVPQEIKMGSYIFGHPAVKNMCRRLRFVSESASKKIYVSRSKLKTGLGGICNEKMIEDRVREEGYTIIYPESISIREQLEVYSSAENLIFADGSAVHLYALVARPEQKVFVIWRRGIYGIFDWQISTFGGPRVQGDSFVEELWVPQEEAPDIAHGRAIVDFKRLSEQLLNKGFISNKTPWQNLTSSEVEAELAEVSSKEGRKFVKVSVPT